MDHTPSKTGKEPTDRSTGDQVPASGYFETLSLPPPTSSSSSSAQPTHAHPHLDAMLNLDSVEREDRAIEQAEAKAHLDKRRVGGGGGDEIIRPNSCDSSCSSYHGSGGGGGGRKEDVGVGNGGCVETGAGAGAGECTGNRQDHRPYDQIPHASTPDTPGAASTTTLLGTRWSSSDDGLGGKIRLHAKVLRPQGIAKVTNIELFYDLVYVYAISAIAHTMEHHLTWETVLEMLVVTLAVWWAWIFSAWVFNWFNPDSYLIRLLLLSIMLVSLIMSSVISESYGKRSLIFAGMYVLIQVGRSLVSVIVLSGHRLQKTFLRILAWFVVTGALWLFGGAIGGTTRNILWTIAIAIEYMSPAAGFYTPGFGMSTTADWTINGGHMAERCSLFIIIALGESIVVTGESFQEVLHSTAGVFMFIVAFLSAASMWWIYFHSASEEAAHQVEHSSDPGQMGRLSYTYIHAIMVIGIIWVAVGDRLALDHPYMVPADANQRLFVAILLGGPILFVVGHALFRWTFCSCRAPWGHLVAIALLVAATPIGLFCPVWATAFATTSVMFVLASWESFYRCYILPHHQPSNTGDAASPSPHAPC
ncbi:hypothetical protein BGZ73_006948 [Actinomortierella ambigua]|nr:hypothetical protein BGZ73_006948 [Actinomortierella ambigua]